MKRNIIAITLSLALILACVAFAENENYSYNKGKQENEARQGVYEQLPDHTESIDKSAYSDPHTSLDTVPAMNTEDLIQAGIIDQTTADAIKAYAAARHESISAIYEGIADMTPQGRSEAFANKRGDDDMGDTAGDLLAAGIITQEQADAIVEFMSK